MLNRSQLSVVANLFRSFQSSENACSEGYSYSPSRHFISQENSSRTYGVKVSYIEIYKEELLDLLDLDTSSKDMHIREDDKGNTCELV